MGITRLQFIEMKLKNFIEFCKNEFKDYSNGELDKYIDKIQLEAWIGAVQNTIKPNIQNIDNVVKEFLNQNGVEYDIITVEKPEAINKMKRYLKMFCDVVV